MNNIISKCPLIKFLDIFAKKWSSYIIYVLYANGEIRFLDLQRKIDKISKKVLTEKLRDLEKYGIVSRNIINDKPLEVTYKLTEQGYELSNILKNIEKLSFDWEKRGII